MKDKFTHNIGPAQIRINRRPVHLSSYQGQHSPIEPFMFAGTRADLAQDLHAFDPSSVAWIDLSSPASGQPPSARQSFGFTSVSGKLYVYGGVNGDGGKEGEGRLQMLDTIQLYAPAISTVLSQKLFELVSMMSMFFVLVWQPPLLPLYLTERHRRFPGPAHLQPNYYVMDGPLESHCGDTANCKGIVRIYFGGGQALCTRRRN